ncbi:MAG: hypothetical protein HZC54_15820 [Verrucomicrobia bacterium]|nr:hypothetical protein [Verrucomicrobiota bacterium]
MLFSIWPSPSYATALKCSLQFRGACLSPTSDTSSASAWLRVRFSIPQQPAADRRPCLMQDPIYRLDVVGGAQGCYQVPGISRLPSTNPPR